MNEMPSTRTMTTDVQLNNEIGVERRQILLVVGVFLICCSLLSAIYINFPNLDSDERLHFKLPKDVDDAKSLGRILLRYKDEHYLAVLGSIIIVYIMFVVVFRINLSTTFRLQSFAIPGSIFLSILSGYLFSFPIAILLVCTCSACGAVVCYTLSFMVGRKLVTKYFPQRVQMWQLRVANHRDNLLNYIIFLRVTPFLPNWFINIASPVIDVPLSPFFWGTFIGVAPPSFVFIQAGTTLQEMTSTGSAMTYTSIVLLAIFAILSLLPVLMKNRLRHKIE